MQIDKPTPAEHAEFLALVDAEIRPHRAKTHAWDDFPLILHADNRSSVLIARGDDGRLAGGIASLTREFTTNYGNIKVAGIGSVVTRDEHRGQGISRTLQNALLDRLRGQGVPLAVLWTDKPEIYAGRGFVPAGWEFHLDLGPARFEALDVPPGTVRPFGPGDVDMVVRLYELHPYRTLRNPADYPLLYNMPGTKGMVWEQEDLPGRGARTGVVFCGKGADFPDYVTEWGGHPDCVIPLLAWVRELGLATRLLVPAGEEPLVEKLVQLGAGWEIRPAGLWCVLDPEFLSGFTGEGTAAPDRVRRDARYWLGGVGEDGVVEPGPIKIGVWGFDSV